MPRDATASGATFEEFEVGDVYRHWPGRTVTEAEDHLFCMLTHGREPRPRRRALRQDGDGRRPQPRRRHVRLRAAARDERPRHVGQGDRGARHRAACATSRRSTTATRSTARRPSLEKRDLQLAPERRNRHDRDARLEPGQDTGLRVPPQLPRSDEGASVTIVGAHHTCYQVADLAALARFYRDLLGFELVWERVNQEEYVREIVGQPEATLHQAMLRFPGSDHMLELIDYRGVERTPVDTNPVNPGTAHICLLVSDFREYVRHAHRGRRPVGQRRAGRGHERAERGAARGLHDRPGRLPARAARGHLGGGTAAPPPLVPRRSRLEREDAREGAPGSRADQVFLDLEDAVAPLEKNDATRQRVVDALRRPGLAAATTVRAGERGEHALVLPRHRRRRRAARRARSTASCVPKVETRRARCIRSTSCSTQLERELGLEPRAIGLEVQIETPARARQHRADRAGLRPRIETLIFGPGDFAAQRRHAAAHRSARSSPSTRATSGTTCSRASSRTARAFGLQAIDGPYAQIRDPTGFRDVARALAAARLRRQVGAPPRSDRRLQRDLLADAGRVRASRADPRRLRAGDRRRRPRRGRCSRAR